jgi:hypothetical protein
MTCPTCGCATHSMPQTRQVKCSVCKRDKWPYTVAPPPDPYICTLCRALPPATRQAKQKAYTASVAARLARAAQPRGDGVA